MHWLLFIHKILISSTCFEPQVLIFRRIQLCTCSIWYCHSHREWQYHMLQVYSCILLKMSTWISKHVEENRILWLNNNQCIKLVINIKSTEEMLHFEVQRQILSKRTNLNILTQTLYGDVLFVTTLFLVLKQKFSSFLKWKWQENCGSRSI